MRELEGSCCGDDRGKCTILPLDRDDADADDPLERSDETDDGVVPDVEARDEDIDRVKVDIGSSCSGLRGFEELFVDMTTCALPKPNQT